jgi:pSer/pThr/pTyr-binding forkhead associated (FHA) protein
LLVCRPRSDRSRRRDRARRRRLAARPLGLDRPGRLAFGKDGWLVEHNALATNPTLVNGDPVKRKLVLPGDRIRMGRVMLEIRSRSARQLSQSAAATREEHTEMIRTDAIATTQLRVGRGLWGHVLIVQGPGKLTGTRLPLQSDSITIGRAQDCDLVLLDPGVSRRHAEIVRDGDQVVLLHRSETNPTLPAPRGRRTAARARRRDRRRGRWCCGSSSHEQRDAGRARRRLRKVMEARVDLEQRISASSCARGRSST